MSDATDNTTIGEYEKNARERIRVSLATFKGHRFCDVRVYAATQDGTYVPTKSGITTPLTRIPALIDLLSQADAAANNGGVA